MENKLHTCYYNNDKKGIERLLKNNEIQKQEFIYLLFYLLEKNRLDNFERELIEILVKHSLNIKLEKSNYEYIIKKLGEKE